MQLNMNELVGLIPGMNYCIKVQLALGVLVDCKNEQYFEPCGIVESVGLINNY